MQSCANMEVQDSRQLSLEQHIICLTIHVLTAVSHDHICYDCKALHGVNIVYIARLQVDCLFTYFDKEVNQS